MPKTSGTKGLEKATPFSAFEFWCKKMQKQCFLDRSLLHVSHRNLLYSDLPDSKHWWANVCIAKIWVIEACVQLWHERIFVYVVSRRGVIILARRGRSAKLLLLITGVALRPPNWICLRLDLPNYISAAKSWSWYITWKRVMMLMQFLAIRRVWGQWVSYQQPHGDTSPDADNTYSLSLQLGLSHFCSPKFSTQLNVWQNDSKADLHELTILFKLSD